MVHYSPVNICPIPRRFKMCAGVDASPQSSGGSLFHDLRWVMLRDHNSPIHATAHTTVHKGVGRIHMVHRTINVLYITHVVLPLRDSLDLLETGTARLVQQPSTDAVRAELAQLEDSRQQEAEVPWWQYLRYP